MSHMVRAVYMDYNLTYVGDTITDKFRHFMMGLYQGNGCEPQTCYVIRYILLLVFQNQGFDIHFVKKITI